MVRHAGPDTDGATRWRCPFCAGLLRARKFPKTMRKPKTVPLVPIAEGCDRCCNGILTAQAGGDGLVAAHHRIGTTAWRITMGRRQVVESANAALKGAFADLGRGFLRVFGQTKMTVLLGFTLAAYNLDRIRSFRAKHAPRRRGRAGPARSRKQGPERHREPAPGPTSSSGTSPPD